MTEMEQAKKITALEKDMQDLKKQLEDHNLSVNRRLEAYNTALNDNATESHKIKHALDNISANFIGFKNVFETGQAILKSIHETLLSANYEKRITSLEKEADDSRTFRTSVKTTVEVIKSVGIIQVVTIIIGVTAAIIKFIILK